MLSSGGRGEYDVLEELSNTETEDETAVATRKRLQNNRRVSFADNEITSVHIFRRDDDYDVTPPSDQDKSSDKAVEEDGAIGLFRDSQDSQETTPRGRESGQEEDEDVDGLPGVFFRPMESPSPGSCTVGSFASSIDEDNAFGPVYASLIRQGRLSESPVSNDENHEITMDSTAFSLHFQRLLTKSDRGDDLKTPYTYPLSLEERTPSHRTNSRSSMSLTNTKTASPRSASPILKSRSAGKDSNAMSLIGENTSKYEYGRLSPSLEALLEISLLGNDASAKNHVGSSPNKAKGIVGTQEASDTITPVHLGLVTAKSPHQEAPLVRPANIFPEKDDIADANTSTISLIQTPNQQLNAGLGIVQSPEGSIRLNSLLNVSQKLANEQDYDRSQMKGSISSLAAKRRQLFANVITPTKPSATSPPAKLSGSLFEEETARPSSSLSAIWKNISRLKNPDSSPTSAHKIETLAMKLKLSTPLLSSPNKDEAPSSLDLLGKPAVSPLTLSGHLLCDDRSGMNTPMNPVGTESNREYTQSPSNKIRELIQSPAATGFDQNPSKEIHHVQMQNMTKSTLQKRRGETNLENDSPLSKVARLQITPIQTVMSSELPDNFVVGKDIIRDGSQSRHWKDVHTKFMEDAANLFSPLVDRLDLREVHVLDDMLVHVQTVRKYEVLHSEIQSQPKSSHLRKNSEKRSSDLTLLFSKIAYEKARLLLDHVKHDRLQKAEDHLKSVLQESHKLSAVYQNSLPSPSKSRPHPSNDKIMQKKVSLLSSIAVEGVRSDPLKIDRGTISSLREENDRLDQTIKSLCRSISAHGKMKGEAVEVKELATASLRKRMTCRFIRQDLQAWKVLFLDTAYGSHAITLDYLGLINQRIVVKANPTPSLTISNRLDSSKIEKRFPNMAASTAFAFLFPAQTVEKYARSRSLAPGTQITSTLLHNLLDVIEEVQLARLQIDNLVDASFHAYAAGQLHLLLSFIGFNKDRKLTLTLDMTCLIRGVYPSEIRPHSLEAVNLEKDETLALVASIKAAIEVLSPGHLRIMNLCECVSKAMEI